MAKILILMGADVGKANRFGTTPTMMAAWKNQDEILHALLQRDVSLKDQDLNGNTALLLSIIYGNYATTELLLKAEEDPNQRNRQGIAAVDLAIKYSHVDIANLLMAYGARRPKVLGN